MNASAKHVAWQTQETPAMLADFAYDCRTPALLLCLAGQSLSPPWDAAPTAPNKPLEALAGNVLAGETQHLQGARSP